MKNFTYEVSQSMVVVSKTQTMIEMENRMSYKHFSFGVDNELIDLKCTCGMLIMLKFNFARCSTVSGYSE